MNANTPDLPPIIANQMQIITSFCTFARTI